MTMGMGTTDIAMDMITDIATTATSTSTEKNATMTIKDIAILTTTISLAAILTLMKTLLTFIANKELTQLADSALQLLTFKPLKYQR